MLTNPFIQVGDEVGPGGDAPETQTEPLGRLPKRLIDNPSRNTTAKIMEKPIEYLLGFAELQGVQLNWAMYSERITAFYFLVEIGDVGVGDLG